LKSTDLSRVTDKLLHNVVHLVLIEFELTSSMVICTDCIVSCKSNYHTIPFLWILNCLSFIDLGIFKPILALKQNVCVTCLEYEIYSLRKQVNKQKIKTKKTNNGAKTLKTKDWSTLILFEKGGYLKLSIFGCPSVFSNVSLEE
jgi:hypothetical protein